MAEDQIGAGCPAPALQSHPVVLPPAFIQLPTGPAEHRFCRLEGLSRIPCDFCSVRIYCRCSANGTGRCKRLSAGPFAPALQSAGSFAPASQAGPHGANLRIRLPRKRLHWSSRRAASAPAGSVCAEVGALRISSADANVRARSWPS